MSNLSDKDLIDTIMELSEDSFKVTPIYSEGFSEDSERARNAAKPAYKYVQVNPKLSYKDLLEQLVDYTKRPQAGNISMKVITKG